jgi:cytochrome b involved in lipid metabolism
MTNKIIGVVVALVVIIGAIWVVSTRSSNSVPTPPEGTTSAPHETINPNASNPTATTTPAETPASTPTTPTTPTSQGYTATIVATHNNAASCWTIIGSNVYDVTSWISKHPGGRTAILATCGIDATAAFTRQHGSSAKAQAALATFLIGSLSS